MREIHSKKDNKGISVGATLHSAREVGPATYVGIHNKECELIKTAATSCKKVLKGSVLVASLATKPIRRKVEIVVINGMPLL